MKNEVYWRESWNEFTCEAKCDKVWTLNIWHTVERFGEASVFAALQCACVCVCLWGKDSLRQWHCLPAVPSSNGLVLEKAWTMLYVTVKCDREDPSTLWDQLVALEWRSRLEPPPAPFPPPISATASYLHQCLEAAVLVPCIMKQCLQVWQGRWWRSAYLYQRLPHHHNNHVWYCWTDCEEDFWVSVQHRKQFFFMLWSIAPVGIHEEHMWEALLSFHLLVAQAILLILVPILGHISPPKLIFGVTTWNLGIMVTCS